MDQWNKIESPEVDSDKQNQPTFDKEQRQYNGAKKVFNKWYQKMVYEKQTEFRHRSYTFHISLLKIEHNPKYNLLNYKTPRR